eukprot:gene21333-27639_t
MNSKSNVNKKEKFKLNKDPKKSIKQDPIQIRVMAFLKRLALMLVHCPSPIVGGILYLISEILKISIRDRITS